MNKKIKQIFAIIGIVILVGMYIASFIFAIFDFPNSTKLFGASLFATIALPILFWIYIGLFGALTNKKNMASIFPEDVQKPSSPESTDANLVDTNSNE